MKNTFTRFDPKPKEGYFLRRQLLEGKPQYTNDPLIAYDTDKEAIFIMLRYYEEAGVPVYVENLKGERIS